VARFSELSVLQWGRGCSAAESTRTAQDLDHAPAASMGPRLFSRGKAITRRGTRWPARSLQWGRGCSAAERLPNRF